MSEIPVNILPKEKRLVQVIPLGDEMPYDFRRPHRHEYFEFFVFNNGGGSHFIDFTEHKIADHSVHIIFPSQIHLLKRAGARGNIIICLKEFMNSLDKLFYSQLFRHNYTAPAINFTKEKFQEILHCVNSLRDELKDSSMLSTELAKSYLTIFLSCCIRRNEEMPESNGTTSHQPDIEIFRKFSNLLDKKFMEKAGVSDYASDLAITPKVLNNCIKKLTGKTTIDLIQERTLTEAKRLLLYTDMTSKEIAYTLNFTDTSYFTRFFTRLEGKTPSAFKAYWEEKYHSSE
jgi:AraC family transcriptional regulator, transcriptional activator of pobA